MSVPSGSRAGNVIHDHASGGDEEDSDDEFSAALVAEVSHQLKEEQRPKKRRKLSAESGGDTIPAQPAEDNSEELDAVPSTLRSPALPVALPSFPLPSQPDAPSKAALALQGLDKAVIEAEFVDPRRTVPIQFDAPENEGNGLSERVIKRLQDLGVTELFAGKHALSTLSLISSHRCMSVQTAVIPFLLSSHRQRQLYLPYNRLRDICVSAPTGSGKTLAYVVPIVEVSR